MKFLQIGSLILAATSALAQSGCVSEMEKVAACISNSNENQKEPNSKESATEFCKLFENEACKIFPDDSVSIKECDLNNPDEKTIAQTITALKVGYLTYCVKDSAGNFCPLTQYIFDNIDKKTDDKTTYDEASKKIFIEDCKVSECNSRMTKYIPVIEEFNNLSGSNTTNEFAPLLDYYKNNKCDDIMNIKEDAATSAGKSSTDIKDDDKKSSASTVKVTLGLSLISFLAAFFAF